MQSKFLFPHSWRIAGYISLVLDFAFAVFLKLAHPNGFAQEPNGPVNYHMIIHNDIHILLAIAGLLLIAFSKEKIEDEHILQVRADSLQWAIYVNYLIFMLLTIVFNGIPYLLNVVTYGVVSPLIFFIVRFRWKLYILNRSIR